MAEDAFQVENFEVSLNLLIIKSTLRGFFSCLEDSGGKRCYYVLLHYRPDQYLRVPESLPKNKNGTWNKYISYILCRLMNSSVLIYGERSGKCKDLGGENASFVPIAALAK